MHREQSNPAQTSSVYSSSNRPARTFLVSEARDFTISRTAFIASPRSYSNCHGKRSVPPEYRRECIHVASFRQIYDDNVWPGPC